MNIRIRVLFFIPFISVFCYSNHSKSSNGEVWRRNDLFFIVPKWNGFEGQKMSKQNNQPLSELKAAYRAAHSEKLKQDYDKKKLAKSKTKTIQGKKQ